MFKGRNELKQTLYWLYGRVSAGEKERTIVAQMEQKRRRNVVVIDVHSKFICFVSWPFLRRRVVFTVAFIFVTQFSLLFVHSSCILRFGSFSSLNFTFSNRLPGFWNVLKVYATCTIIFLVNAKFWFYPDLRFKIRLFYHQTRYSRNYQCHWKFI